MEDRQHSVILRIGSAYYSLTPAEKRLADYILANQERVVRQSISELAQQSGVAEVLAIDGQTVGSRVVVRF